MFFSAIASLIAATAVAASPVEVKRNNGGPAVCRSFYADITASARNYLYKPIIGGV
jgi:hypothetical protein